jgi:hypothetical protein
MYIVQVEGSIESTNTVLPQYLLVFNLSHPSCQVHFVRTHTRLIHGTEIVKLYGFCHTIDIFFGNKCQPFGCTNHISLFSRNILNISFKLVVFILVKMQ